ncbi:MAG: caspase family protein, partial [Smithella sp.]
MFKFKHLFYSLGICLGIIFILSMSSASAAGKLAPASSKQRPDIFIQTGHSSNVASIDFSPDGKYLVSGSSDKNIKLWEVETGREIRTFVANDMIDFVAFSPDGKSLLSLESKGPATLWDVKTGKKIRTLRKGSKALITVAVAFSPDGTVIAAACTHDKDDSENFVFRTIQLFDTKTGRRIKTIEGHTSNIHSIVFSPDGKYLASGSQAALLDKTNGDNTVRLWNVKTGKEIHCFAGHSKGVSKVVFSPDGQFVASIGEDRNIFFWDTKKGGKARSLAGFPSGDINTRGTIAFSPDGRRFVAASSFPSAMILWNVATGQVEATMKDDNNIHDAAVSFSPDSRHIAVSAGNNVSLWDAASHRKIRTFGGDVRGINIAFFSADQEKIKIAGNEELTEFSRRQGHFIGRRIIEIFDNWNNGREDWGNRRFFKTKDNGYHVIDSKADRSIISTSTDDYPIAYDSPRQAFTFSPDGLFALITGKDQKEVKLFNTRSQQITALENFPRYFSITAGGYAAFSPDGSRLAATSYSDVDERNYLCFWDTATGRQTLRLKSSKNKESLSHLVFFADGGRMIVSRGWNEGIIGLWNLTAGKEIRTFSGHSSSITSLALSGDEKYIGSGDWVGTIKLWDIRTGGEIKTLKGHANEIKSLLFSPDGKNVLSASQDGTTRLWDITSGREIAQFVSFNNGEWIVITPEGYYNASPGGDRHLNVRVGGNVYGIENYREAFFRPDLVAVALQGGSLKNFRNIADVKQPPQVSIVDTPHITNKDEITVNLKITDNGGGIGDIKLYLNGTSVMLDGRGLQNKSRESKSISKSYRIKLSQGLNIIKAIVFNAENTMQSNETMQEITASFAAAARPKMHALIIGIDDYDNPKLKLMFARADAKLFADTIKETTAGLFSEATIKTLTGKEDTSKEHILKELKALQKLHPDDLFVFYAASHGIIDSGEYFMLTSDVGSLSSAKLKEKAISQTELKELIANIPTTKKLIVIDTCSAGALGDAIQMAMMTRGVSEETAMKILSYAVGSMVISASTSQQEALEGYK